MVNVVDNWRGFLDHVLKFTTNGHVSIPWGVRFQATGSRDSPTCPGLLTLARERCWSSGHCDQNQKDRTDHHTERIVLGRGWCGNRAISFPSAPDQCVCFGDRQDVQLVLAVGY